VLVAINQHKKMETDTTDKPSTPASGLHEPTCSPFVFCEADLEKGRKIKAEQGEGVFRFTLRDGRKTRKIEMSDDEAWVVGKIISAMHPHISGSNDPLWHQIQEQRKIILENADVGASALNQTP
jgi:hypothetical protein